MKGMVVSGGAGDVLIRKKHDSRLELGELLIADAPEGLMLLQVFDLLYGSQLNQSTLELVSGLRLEEEAAELMDSHLRTYILARAKQLCTISNRKPAVPKSLPPLFIPVRQVDSQDINFITAPKHPLQLGMLRSGSQVLDVPIAIDGTAALSHHILISATTGKGKSNLASHMLWHQADKEYCGILVLDPHDEYFGRDKPGLKDHQSGKVLYYTPDNPPPGARTLKIHLSLLQPHHFDGAVAWSDAQREALLAYYKTYHDAWIEAICTDQPIQNFMEGTLQVVKRRMLQLLDLSANEKLTCHGVFDLSAGKTTIADIVRELDNAKTVIIDTSDFSGAQEILIGSMVAHDVLQEHKRAKVEGRLGILPVISVMIEEAPRVLGREVLERGTNIFSTIAREGRKFKVGLIAITQLPSLISRDILANINTKIILGTEMKPERQALIDSAAQDLSSDDRHIASLDKGEAIVTSTFVPFAIPIKIPLFEIEPKQAQRKAGLFK